MKEAASEAAPRNDRSNWRLFRFDEFWALTCVCEIANLSFVLGFQFSKISSP
ncbi:hypothetical protein ACE6H2_006880 [Prunus campanulata]